MVRCSLKKPRAYAAALAALATALPFLCPAATPPISAADPTAFFTNVAARLLRSELRFDLNRIEVYPTNRYDPVVHRLLQITANIYDATPTARFPGILLCPPCFVPCSGETTRARCLSPATAK